jgi:hypothetical protein
LPAIAGEVLNKTAAFYGSEDPDARPAKPMGDRKNC